MNVFGQNPIGFEGIYIRSEQEAKDNLAQTILNELLNLYNASRTYIFSFDEGFKLQKCLYEVCADGVTEEKDNLQEVPTSLSRWWCDELREYKTITIKNLDESRKIIGEDTYQLLYEQNIKSLLVAPLSYRGWVYGYIGIDKVNEYYNWDKKDIQVINAFASSFTSVIYQKEKVDFYNKIPRFQKYLPNYLEILGTLPVNILIYSPDGILQGGNKQARDFFYLDDNKEALIVGHTNLFDHFQLSDDVKDSFYKGKPFKTEIKFFPKNHRYGIDNVNNTFYYFSCSAIPLVNADKITNAYLLVLTDITERYLMAESLRKAKKEAEQSDKLKSAFLANMSHEIRTPLNAIVGFSGLMTEAETEEERSEYSKIINNNTEILLCLISDILDLSKIESGAMTWNMKDIDFSLFFDELAVSLKQKVNPEQLDFIVENPCKKCIVCIDKNRLAQAITNYVTNSIKYTNKGYVKMGYRIKGKGIEVYVEDSGIGIADSKKDKVFKRFEKLDQFAAGNGLGLSITKGLIEAVGGKVYFDSKEGKGSTFYLWRPCEKMEYQYQ